jgi:hypothetical protein
MNASRRYNLKGKTVANAFVMPLQSSSLATGSRPAPGWLKTVGVHENYPHQIRLSRLASAAFVAILFSKALLTGPINHDRPGRV